MKAMTLSANGGPEVLVLQDVPKPAIRPDQNAGVGSQELVSHDAKRHPRRMKKGHIVSLLRRSGDFSEQNNLEALSLLYCLISEAQFLVSQYHRQCFRHCSTCN